MSTNDDHLGIELIGDGERAGSWGNITNINLETIIAAITQKQTVSITVDETSSSPKQIAIADGSKTNEGGRAFIELTDNGDKGATQHFQLTPNNAERIIYFKNSLTTQAAKIFQTDSFDDTKDVQIENGETAILYFDGGGSSSATVTKILSDPIFTTVQSSGAATLNSATVTNNLTVSGNIVVTGTVDGRDLSGDGAKLDGIEAEAEKNQTTTEIFTAIKGVDGTGSGLDADLLDGQQGSYYQPASTAITTANISSQSVASATTATTATSATSATTATSATSATNATNAANVDVTATSSNSSFRMVFGPANNTSGNQALFKDSSTSFYYNPSTNQLNVGSLVASGDVTAFSDVRLKDNIATLDGTKVFGMRGVSFTKDNKKSSGVIAQELEGIAPELVYNDSEYKAVAYGNITAYLIEAIKHLKKEIEELKGEKANDPS